MDLCSNWEKHSLNIKQKGEMKNVICMYHGDEKLLMFKYLEKMSMIQT